MTKSTHTAAALLLLAVAATALLIGLPRRTAALTAPSASHHNVPPVLDFTMKSLDGHVIDFARYQGRVILIVNTASKCGYTPQYAPLEKLYRRFSARGLVILGFPSNNFGHQEPGTDKQISTFCTRHYGVTFPMFHKVDVKGPHQCPLYRFLTDPKTDPRFAGTVRWNFEKFLISRTGAIVARFRSPIRPDSATLIGAVKTQLAK